LADDAKEDEDAFDEPEAEEAEGESLFLPSQDRVMVLQPAAPTKRLAGYVSATRIGQSAKLLAAQASQRPLVRS
jgi:hypothetical protein